MFIVCLLWFPSVFLLLAVTNFAITSDFNDAGADEHELLYP